MSKLNDAETEAAETQTWLKFSRECGYLQDDAFQAMTTRYDLIIGKIVRMITNPDPWVLAKGG